MSYDKNDPDGSKARARWRASTHEQVTAELGAMTHNAFECLHPAEQLRWVSSVSHKTAIALRDSAPGRRAVHDAIVEVDNAARARAREHGRREEAAHYRMWLDLRESK